MPISAATTYNASRLDPYIDPSDAVTIPYTLVPNAAYTKGTVLGLVTNAVNDVQTLTITASGGTYTISWTDPISGVVKTTASLNYNDNAAAIQSALNAAGVLGTSGVGVTGTGPFVITFSGTAYAGKAQNLMTVNTGSLTGGSASIAHTTSGAPAGAAKAYASGNSDGSQVARAILQYDCYVDALGNVYLGVSSAVSPFGETRKDVPCYISGTFDTSKLTGLDATALSSGYWRLVQGSLALGVVRLG